MPTPVTIRPATPADIPTIATLADIIWRQHYPAIISMAQIDYMLAQRYNPTALLHQISGPDQWLDLALAGEQVIGFTQYYCNAPGEMKLDKLYLLPDLHGQGLGSQLLRHVVAQAQARQCTTLVLAVNKHNAKAIAAYTRNGFTVRDSVTVDIGHGYLMDDFIMVKNIG
ncbi:GNAT family N-acetyltransferase [Chitinimonas viridis]|uniref:GNAT family N-acetyltransferase n=1 Tax=Chitinimonas viridis TaxID=664880 RepID=A0ABT8BAJ5_9NEIS|nr:GNAT family N-acetyltransferase [Chitinimonas viridis]MDN3579168.1 GNAT family N-acetyltransferase [Chitinimonas viridis]